MLPHSVIHVLIQINSFFYWRYNMSYVIHVSIQINSFFLKIQYVLCHPCINTNKLFFYWRYNMSYVIHVLIQINTLFYWRYNMSYVIHVLIPINSFLLKIQYVLWGKNHIDGVMFNVLASSVVDGEFEPRNRAKPYTIKLACWSN